MDSFLPLKTRIGHATLKAARTGCTVLLFDAPAVCGVQVAGGAPGTRDTDMLDPSCLVERVNAILLTGGSAFGLASADGVMKFLAERKTGFKVGDDVVPIVPGAVIYDRRVGKRAAPTAKDGYRACKNAGYSIDDFGAVGAGCGALTGKFSAKLTPGMGGMAAVCLPTPSGALVGAVVVVNPFGNVVDPRTGEIVSGATDKKGMKVPFDGKNIRRSFGENTVIGSVVTDAALTKAQAKRVAMAAHDGIARTVSPAHTLYDGDVLFAASTGKRKADLNIICHWAALAVESAILKAVSAKTGTRVK
ncbi:MAG: P1 family peptidase [Nitrospinae bacterium]|nr:P1 family peptidase [Nitrospinota bacterium]